VPDFIALINSDLSNSVSFVLVGAAIGRPPKNCIAIVGFPEEITIFSPYIDTVLFYKIVQAINDRPYIENR